MLIGTSKEAPHLSSDRTTTPVQEMPVEVSGSRSSSQHGSQFNLESDFPQKETERATVRIMSYNILYGFDWEAVRDLIRANPVDVLCLQEVPQEGYSDAEAVSPQSIMTDFDWPNDLAMLWHPVPRRAGNMTLTQGAIRPGEVLRAWPTWGYGILNEIVVNGAKLVVANTHLSPMFGPPVASFLPTEVFRLREVLHLTRRCQGFGGPVVALGDFNSFWPAPVCWYMRRHWQDCRLEVGGAHLSTRPTYGLPFVIDHIYTRGDVSVEDYRVIDGPGSDHRPVIVQLSLPRCDDSDV